MKNQIVKEQFNRQAQNFIDWTVTTNTRHMQGYFDFCRITPDDTLLDVACGPGALTVYAASQVEKATGVDISDREIEIARGLALDFGLSNVRFDCSDVENLPYGDDSFSVVLCKSAFHHFVEPDRVIGEMKRCGKRGGKISIQDIVAYHDPYVDHFFETFEHLVDVSHHKTMSEAEIGRLYADAGISVSEDLRLPVDLNVSAYIEHAVQDAGTAAEIRALLARGLADGKLTNRLFYKENELYFRRDVYLVLGTKK